MDLLIMVSSWLQLCHNTVTVSPPKKKLTLDLKISRKMTEEWHYMQWDSTPQVKQNSLFSVITFTCSENYFAIKKKPA